MLKKPTYEELEQRVKELEKDSEKRRKAEEALKENEERFRQNVFVDRDITNEVELERRLHQAQKMEAIGTLAGGIAHDFNNILGAIMGYAEMVLFELPENSPALRNIDQVLRASDRARNLVKQILAFSKQSEQERRKVKLCSIVEEALKLLRATIPTTIAIRRNIKDESGTVLADSTQIHQVLMNLCTNAHHAMAEKGGVMTVSLMRVDLNAYSAAAHPDLKAGPYLKLSVIDTGDGMNSETLDRVFEPYFTTKGTGKGTGMGLAVVHGIVKGHGGAITVQSCPGQGTTFQVFFPRMESEPVSEKKRLNPPSNGKERILLIDDEEILVDLGKQMLSRLGYKVMTRTSPLDALEDFRIQPDDFDLVITDMTMPKMRGDMLASEINQIRPDIPIIICTGYGKQMSEAKANSLGIRDFLTKPLSFEELSRTIRRLLDNN